MANEESKDFNAMLHKDNGMPKIRLCVMQPPLPNMAEKKCFWLRL